MRVSIRVSGLSAEKTIGIAQEQLGKAIERLNVEPTSDLDEVVHDVRKRIKKGRALLKLVRGTVRPKAISKVDHWLRDAARPLSAVRDASALILALDKLAERSVGLVPAEAFAESRAALVEHRAEIVRRELVEGSVLSEARKAIRQAQRRMARWHPDCGDLEPISGLKRVYKQGREAFEAASNHPTPESLHELRKQVKTLLYQLRVLGANPETPAARLQNLTSLLAADLGELHDLDVLRSFLEGLETSVPILVVLDRRRVDLRRGSLQRAGVIFLDKPCRFVRSLDASVSPIEAARSDR